MVNQSIKKRALHRAKILKGQLEALMRSIESEEYCTSLLHQSYSIQNSLKSLDKLLLENHLGSHVRHQMQDPAQQEKAIKELIEVYTSSHR
ncbi:metal-sensing transcriptional repressor [Candidatus Peregrinibacteria bacterium]|nr:MAG: metal-sensing transcriptional repressor [Candidatus Peregrinibacteria bacterium]